jgi:uncharacterized protein Yka (UPF0111/DUF47 family)|tara:strand:- start:308 stop:574 length:267 start_codon:yes stop_codon:yes gene_type:complete
MKITKKEATLFKESHNRYLSESSFLAKLFTRAVKKGIDKDPNISNAIKRADTAIDKARAEIEMKLNGDKDEIKKAIPLSVRKYLGFKY